MTQTLLLFLSAVLLDNLILSRALGTLPLLSDTETPRKALQTGLSLLPILLLSGILLPLLSDCLPITFLVRIPVYLLLTALFAFLTGWIADRLPEAVRRVFRAPDFTSCGAALALAFLLSDYHLTVGQNALFSLGAAFGLTLIFLLLSGLRDRLLFAEPPRCFRGLPMILVTVGLIALCFSGFDTLLLTLFMPSV